MNTRVFTVYIPQLTKVSTRDSEYTHKNKSKYGTLYQKLMWNKNKEAEITLLTLSNKRTRLLYFCDLIF